MYGNAYFGDSQMANVLVVNRNAFVGSVSSNEVFVLKNGKAILTNVTTGRTYGDLIEVTSGLNAGDQVIVSGQINLVNESVVEIIK
jgi:membrane fusion protein, multidrug efflux system